MTKLKSGTRKSLEPEIVELLESEPVVKLGKEFPGARIIYVFQETYNIRKSVTIDNTLEDTLRICRLSILTTTRNN